MRKLIGYIGLCCLIIVGTFVYVRSALAKNQAKAEDIYEKVVDLQHKAKTVCFTTTMITEKGKSSSCVLMIKKPNLYRLEYTDKIKTGDGKSECVLNLKKGEYSTNAMKSSRPGILNFVTGFHHFTAAKVTSDENLPELSSYKGIPAVRTRMIFGQGKSQVITDYYYSTKTYLPLALVERMVTPREKDVLTTIEYSNVVLDKELPDSLFNTHPGPPYKKKSEIPPKTRRTSPSVNSSKP